MIKKKKLIINSEYGFYPCGEKTPICDATNNSNSTSWDYIIGHNCEWQVAFEEEYHCVYFDVDFLCLAIRSNSEPDDNNDIVFWNNLYSSNYGIQMQGDNIGGACPPNEIFWIDFDKIDGEVVQMDFIFSIYDSEKRGLDFSSISKMRVRVEGDKDDLMHSIEAANVFQYDIDELPYTSSVIKIASLVRESLGWSYISCVEAIDMSLIDVIRRYGFKV